MTELYDRLLSKCLNLSFGKEPSKLVLLSEQINGFDHQASEMTFVLIRIHSLRSGHSKGFFQLPYEGKSTSVSSGDTSMVNVSFNLEQFPEELLCLLDQFAKTVEGTKSETKIKPARSPRSPRNAPMSFLKKSIKQLPEIILSNIDCAMLDKTYSMNEILKYGEKSFLTEMANDLTSTSIDEIGLVDESRQQPRLILEISEELDHRASLYRSNRTKKDHSEHCYYCTLSIPSTWQAIDVYQGVFCSFHCARSYSIEYRKEYKELLDVFLRLTGRDAPIITRSPDRRLLQKFGGSLSEEEYRRMFNAIYPVQTILQSMIDPICTSGDDGNDGYASYTRSSSLQGVYYKPAMTCDIRQPELCTRVYKAN